MQESQDTIILDEDGQNSINVNSSTLKFDDILVKSNDLVNNDSKKQQITKTQVMSDKNASKLVQVAEKIKNEPECEQVIYIIQKYQSSERFGEFIRKELKINYSSENLGKKSLQELRSILAKIRIHLDNKNLSKIYDGAMFSGTMLIEMMSRPIANVDGYSKLLMENEEFLNCWERIKCETMMPQVPAHVQLVFILGQTYFMAYALNKANEPPSEEAQKITDEIIQDIEAKETERETEQQKTETAENNEKNDDKPKPPKIENGMGI